MYEDQLPESMTDEEYAEWFALSHVDGVRVGPRLPTEDDTEEGMSRLYLFCKNLLETNPDNVYARSFMEQREEKLRERYKEK